jgi:hypothetical protein
MHTSSRARSIAISLIVVNLCIAPTASAHPEFNPVSTNRYLKLTVLGPRDVRLAYTILYGAGPALAARKAADANADGRLDENETRALGAQALATVQKGLQLDAPITWETPAVGMLGAEVGPIPFSVDLIGRVAANQELHLDDRTELPALGETEIRAEESPTTTLLAFHRGPAATTDGGDDREREDRILFRGPKLSTLEDRTITLRFAAKPKANASPSVEQKKAFPWPVAIGACLLFLVLGVLSRRKRR